MPQYFDKTGAFDRKAIEAQARWMQRRAIEQGATGDHVDLQFCRRFVWRVAAGKRLLDAFRLLEHEARRTVAEHDLHRQG